MSPSTILMIPVLLFSVSLHEFAHAYAAYWGGDDTASRAGRITLNPIAHIDPVGTILVPLICLVQSVVTGTTFFFGWAKPVPVNSNRLRKRSYDVIVSVAGVFANFMLVILAAVILKILYATGTMRSIAESNYKNFEIIRDLGVNFIALNVLLGLFNLIPIPPLDGSHVFYHYFVRPVTRDHPLFKIYQVLERFGFFILLAFLFVIPPQVNPFYIVYNFSLYFILSLI